MRHCNVFRQKRIQLVSYEFGKQDFFAYGMIAKFWKEIMLKLTKPIKVKRYKINIHKSIDWNTKTINRGHYVWGNIIYRRKVKYLGFNSTNEKIND